MEEEIDLRVYIQVLLRHWIWVVGLTLIAAAVAYVFTSLRPDVYLAEAQLAIIPARTNVSFVPQIDTLSGDELLLRGSADTRRTTLLALVQSPQVASQALADVGGRLPPAAQQLSSLQAMVEATAEGDLILVRVRSRNPDRSALVANAWATAAERHINTLYMADDELDGTVESSAESARQTYVAAQAALEAFRAESTLAALNRELAAKQALLAGYVTARDAAQTESATLEIRTKQRILEGYYADLQQIEGALADLQALRDQVEAGSDSMAAQLGDALALIGLRSQGLATEDGSRLMVQLDVSSGFDPVQVGDVDDLIAALEARREATEARIAGLFSTLVEEIPEGLVVASDNALNLRIDGLDADIRALQEQVEIQAARERELAYERDLAWDTYTTLQQKVAEVRVASQFPQAQVRLAGQAFVPELPIPSRRLLNTLVAGVLGFLAGAVLLFLIEFFRPREKLQRDEAGVEGRP